MLVIDIPDDLLENILQRNDALKVAIFIDHHREMLASGAEGLKLVEQQCRLRHEIGIAGNVLNKLAAGGGAFLAVFHHLRPVADSTEQVLDVKHADDVVGIARIDRMAGMRRGQNLAKKRFQIIIGIDHLHSGAVRHDLFDADLVQVEHRGQHGLRFAVVGIAVGAMQLDHAAKFFLAICFVRVLLADQAAGKHAKRDRQRAQNNDDDADGRRNHQRVFVGIGERIGLWHHLGEHHQNDRHGDGGPQHACIIQNRDEDRCRQRRGNDVHGIVADQDRADQPLAVVTEAFDKPGSLVALAGKLAHAGVRCRGERCLGTGKEGRCQNQQQNHADHCQDFAVHRLASSTAVSTSSCTSSLT